MKEFVFILLCILVIPTFVAILVFMQNFYTDNRLMYLGFILCFCRKKELRTGFLIGFNIYIWFFLHLPTDNILYNKSCCYQNITIEKKLPVPLQEPIKFAYSSHPCSISTKIGKNKFRISYDSDCLEKEHQKYLNGR